jgi:hypothetical protein
MVHHTTKTTLKEKTQKRERNSKLYDRLIFLDSTNTQNPQFEISVRSLRHEPDIFCVNKYMKMVEEDLFT